MIILLPIEDPTQDAASAPLLSKAYSLQDPCQQTHLPASSPVPSPTDVADSSPADIDIDSFRLLPLLTTFGGGKKPV
jgi:hypothetical protein